MSKLYSSARISHNLEPYFSNHMMAMTSEDLHSKAAIACELAYRDKRIAELEEAYETARKAGRKEGLERAAEIAGEYYYSAGVMWDIRKEIENENTGN